MTFLFLFFNLELKAALPYSDCERPEDWEAFLFNVQYKTIKNSVYSMAANSAKRLIFKANNPVGSSVAAR